MLVKQKNNKNQKYFGFTMIEVMIALLIVGVVFSGLLTFSKTYIKNYASLNEKYWANQVAWNKIIELHTSVQNLNNLSEKKETYKMLDFDWHVNLKLEKTVTAGIEKATFEVGPQENVYSTSISTFIILNDILQF